MLCEIFCRGNHPALGCTTDSIKKERKIQNVGIFYQLYGKNSKKFRCFQNNMKIVLSSGMHIKLMLHTHARISMQCTMQLKFA